MRVAYYHPDNSTRLAGPRTPMRTALDKAAIDVLDIDATDGRDAMIEQCADIDVWISEACQSAEPDQAGQIAASDAGIPYVVVEPDAGIAAHDCREAAQQIIRQATHIVTTSSATAHYFQALMSVPDDLTLMSTFVDVSPYQAAYKIRELHRARLASALRLPEGSPWLLADGPMEAGDSLQSYAVLARALSRLALMDWKLIIVGGGRVNNEAKELMLRLPHENIRYLEPMPLADFAGLCVSCDMYLWPAVGESPPASLLEAQAGGVPVISGRKHSTLDRVIDGRTGRLTPAGNAESFANAISHLLRHPDFRQSFSEDARETAAAFHDLDTAAVRLGAVLSGLL